MLNAKPGIKAELFGRFNLSGRRPAFFAFGDKLLQAWRIFRAPLCERVICGYRNKACAEHRIGACRKDFNPVVATNEFETAAQPLRFADPVFLHQLHFVWPSIKPAQTVQ